jgi:hypothetical protein
MKMRKKSDLPMKMCVVCGLPFSWRRKWARDWEQVKYCSDRCRTAGAPITTAPSRPPGGQAAATSARGTKGQARS